MKNARQIVFRYNGDANSEETDLDTGGEIVIPQKDAIIERNGKRWKVAQVQQTMAPPALSVYRIFLTDKFS